MENKNKNTEPIAFPKLSYDNVVIYLTKDDGTVLVKGAIKYSDILNMQKMHSALPNEVIGMLFSALESELEIKENKKENESKEIEQTKEQV